MRAHSVKPSISLPSYPTESRVSGGDECRAVLLTREFFLKGQSSITIDHEGTLYTLRITRAGKLILTK